MTEFQTKSKNQLGFAEEGQQGSRVNNHPPKKVIRDGGYGWVIVFASFILQFIGDGVAYTFGLFYVEISKEFPSIGKSGTSWIVSIMIAVTHGIAPVGSILVNKFGCRTVSILGSLIASAGFALSYFTKDGASLMYLTIGVLGGIGFGLLYLPAMVSVPQYFDKKRAFATGIAVSGSGTGTLFFEWAIGLMLAQFVWRECLLITAGIIAISIPFGLLYRPFDTTTEIKHQNLNGDLDETISKPKRTGWWEKVKTAMDWSLLKNILFILFSTADILTSIGFNTPYIYLPEIEQNMSNLTSRTLLGYMGGANVLSRIFLGYFSDKTFVNRHYLYTAALAVAGIATALSPYLKTLAWLRAYSATYGVCMGLWYVSLKSVILVDLLGLDKLTDAFGLLLLLQAIGFFIGAPVVGSFYDTYDTYDYGFYFAGAAIFASSLIVAIIPTVKRRRYK